MLVRLRHRRRVWGVVAVAFGPTDFRVVNRRKTVCVRRPFTGFDIEALTIVDVETALEFSPIATEPSLGPLSDPSPFIADQSYKTAAMKKTGPACAKHPPIMILMSSRLNHVASVSCGRVTIVYEYAGFFNPLCSINVTRGTIVTL